MKISYNWLKDFLPDLTSSPEEVAELLTMHSFETKVEDQLQLSSDVVVAKIIKIDSHPKADRLRLATITNGQQEITVVCGAPNITAGQIVPFSPPGTKLKDEEGHDFTVKAATIRGVKSPGMLNSLRELGLHPKEHEGIWILPDDIPVGTKLADHVPVDTILDADVTPNRAHDCLSHRGLARELAALLKLDIKEPPVSPLPTPEKEVNGFSVIIEDKAKTPRYLGAVLRGVSVQASPLWLQVRLLAAGGKPLNNLVDITNYVTFELGNPTHTFDVKNLPGKTIGTRQARTNEKLVMLDKTEQELTEQDLIITSDDTPVAIAGVMGSQSSGVSATTKDIFLEVASFNAFSIQETARRLGLPTEASSRFSKGLDINLVSEAAQRTINLLQELAGATLTGVLDTHPLPRLPRHINFHPSRVAEVAGSDISTTDQSKQALERLRFSVDSTQEPWQVTAPTDRLDIEGEHDVVEEIIRAVGLSNIVASSAATDVQPQSLPHHSYWHEVIRDTLIQQGMTETLNYSFEPQLYATLSGLHKEDHLSLANPVAPDMRNLRVSLLPGLLKNLATNRDYFHRHAGRKESALFEIGHVYRPGDGNRVPGVVESTHLAAVIVNSTPSLTDIATALRQVLNIDSLELPNIITPKITTALKYHLPVSGFEINLDQLLLRIDQPTPSTITTLADLKSKALQPIRYTPLPKYPPSYRDISILVDTAITIEQVQVIIERTGGKLVADVDLFDQYQPPGENKKSLAFHIAYQSPDKTLTDAEVAQIHNKIVAALQAELAADLR